MVAGVPRSYQFDCHTVNEMVVKMYSGYISVFHILTSTVYTEGYTMSLHLGTRTHVRWAKITTKRTNFFSYLNLKNINTDRIDNYPTHLIVNVCL